ncbi:chorismate synthase [Deltaproteobacteria bacterium]|nr:chorismate synthase [Deltaproteobacteria bacterium]
MASNSFGSLFRFTTWGETHGKAVGVVIDGCPAGIPLNEEDINAALARRAPGKNPYVSPRMEKDRAGILSGVFDGVSTGAPISIIVENGDADSRKYADMAALLRPGHANYTYLQKYGVFDYRGGGRASARETVGRVAAGSIAGQMLHSAGIKAYAWLGGVGCAASFPMADAETSRFREAAAFAETSLLFAPDKQAEEEFIREIERAKRDKDSIGGVVSFAAEGIPPGLGDPVYGKLSALLASAMMSIPASKGFEMGAGFASAALRGSVFNDSFCRRDGQTMLASNRAGGTLGGISNGRPLYGRVAFKPASSIFQVQKTVDLQGNEVEFMLPEGSRHDPCVAVRAVPVVRAMCLLVLADAWLMNRTAR